MRLPLILQKINRPSLPARTVARPRLYARLSDWREYRCIYVHAPAGYGKSVLVSAWIEQLASGSPESTSVRSAWLSLDKGDRDPRQWLWYLTAALDQLQPGLLSALAPLLQDAATSVEVVLARLLAALTLQTQAPCLLVLEDYHQVESTPVDGLMSTLIERAPAWLQFVVISRRATSTPLNRCRATGQMLELDRDDLRFREDELTTFLENWGFGDLPEETVALLLERTEGWIAALQLASHGALREASSTAVLARLQGNQGWLARYLTDELLVHQPPERRRFLLATSILDRFNASLATAVTGSQSTHRLLDEIHTANLFLIPLDDRGEWFRYHHLFRELLQYRLQMTMAPEAIATLHRRAAAWLATAHDIDGALDHLLALPDVETAVALVADHTRAAVVRGDSHQAERWIARLPESAAAASMPILLDRCLLCALRDDPRLLDHVDKAEARLASIQNPSARAQTELLIYRAIGHFLQRNFAATEKATKQAYLQVEELDDFSAGNLHFTLMHYLLHNGKIDEALAHGTRAFDAYKRTEFINGVISVCRESAALAMYSGRSEEATRQFAESAHLAGINRPFVQRELGIAQLRAACHFYWIDQLQRAEEYQQAALTNLRFWDNSGFVAEALCLGQLLHATTQRLASTPEAFSAADLAAHADQYSTPYLYWIRLFMKQGQVDEARIYAQRLTASEDTGLPVHNLMRHIALLHIYTMQGEDRASTASEYERALSTSVGEKYRFLRLLLLSLYAWHQLRVGKRKSAAKLLNEALELANLTGYNRALLDLQELMPLLAASSHPLAGRLLQQMKRESSQQIGVRLTSQEMLVLELLDRDYKYREIAEHLVISLNTVRFHVHNVYAKLGVSRRMEAVARAREVGLIRK